MKDQLKIGTIGEERFVVTERHLIDFAHDGMPEILSTPSLIWFMEHAAINAMLPLCHSGKSTVGVGLNVEHLAATPAGLEVVCRARVIYVDGPLVSFQIEAHDPYELIARGTHKRRLIDVARLAKRVNAKQG
ncbi:thioesterase family protein [Novipirellula artificiosorum]|uniref:Fluoroacetyl-CoA thioesterase n=1 Tax=Novipirellula artificiosorum TaxID=2528016 RepID=A0A5C6DP03_9BACT|nr:hotdog domain-containing protein [Novipirellula artificiosorum]TWU37381.1 Fluoroacetyl-CoA thioesterase [Novipirellula artificiosorum]